jgi:hypothetical protein
LRSPLSNCYDHGVTAKPQKQQLARLRKPMARALRVTLFEREVRETLSASAIEILFQRARILSEGRRAASPTAGDAFFGSTMLTIDLAEVADLVRDPADAATAERLALLMKDDARVQKRVRQIAAQEAERLGGPGARAVEVRLRTEGAIVYLDADVEGPGRG